MKEKHYTTVKPVVSFTIPAYILKKVDRMAEDLSLSRSACVTLILQIYFEGVKDAAKK